MEINELKKILIGKEVLVESKWELMEMDSVGQVKEILKLNNLFILLLDNNTKFVGTIDSVILKDKITLDFINITSEKNEIVVFRIKLL